MRWLVAISLFVAVCSPSSKNIHAENQDHIVEFFDDILDEGKPVVFDEVINNICVYSEKSLSNVYMPDGNVAKNDEDFLIALDSIFSKKDRSYMIKQIENMPTKWDRVHLPERIQLDTSEYLETWRKYSRGGILDSVIRAKWIVEKDSFNKRYGFDSFQWNTYSLSYPIFNKAKDKAIIRISHGCGSLCGEWGIVLYYKIDGHWKRINDFQLSVS